MKEFTIGIKLGDGSFYPIIDQGFTGKKRLILSTIRDNQESMQIDFYRSLDNDIQTAEYIGSLMIEDIKPSQKGEPEIEVILGLDADKKLNAVAKNLASEDKQTLSVVLESLEGDRTYGMPEFELDEDIKTTRVPDEDTDEESITGDTYPFEEEDRRKKHIKKKRNPLLLVLFVFVGLIGIAGLFMLIYWIFSTYNIIENLPPLFGPQNKTEIPDSTDEDSGVEKDDAGTVETGAGGEDTGETSQDETNEQGTETQKEETEEGTDGGASDEETESIKTGFYYVIKRGDTLWDISANFYRDPFQWYRIYREPKNNIKNPDLIFAGDTLYIPEK